MVMCSSLPKFAFFTIKMSAQEIKSEVEKNCSALRDRLRSQKDQSFYLNCHKFSIKSYVLDVHTQHMILWRSTENCPF